MVETARVRGQIGQCRLARHCRPIAHVHSKGAKTRARQTITVSEYVNERHPKCCYYMLKLYDRTYRGSSIRGVGSMSEPSSASKATTGPQPYLSRLAVWALSIGSAIGWGSLVVTSKSYLSQAGPAGSILGLLAGFIMMLMVSSHYHFLANRFPGIGGLYNYIKNVFGYDRAFLVAWYLFLTYISIFWANATSVPLFARYFLRGVFKVGYLYTIFGYEVYLGETLITLVVIALVALLCIKSKEATAKTMVVMVLLFIAGITVVTLLAMLGHRGTGLTMRPAFVPDKGAFRQVLRIAFLSPWAFIGFESVSHSAMEYKFEHKYMFRVLVSAVAVVTALYIFIILLSITAYPEGCSSWLDYIGRLDEFEGIEGLPAFYAAYHYLGDAGVYILMASLLALVLSSLIGMLRAVSRLCYAVAHDGVLPERFSKLSDKRIPVNAILLAVVVSLPIPFLGRTTIGWIVDTTTIGATIVYGFASVAVFKVSGQEGVRRNRLISGICLFILVAFLVYLLLPGFFADHTIETETYVLMIGWSVIGLFFFNWVIRRDHARSFGKAIIVWVAMLAFIVLMSTTLAERINEASENVIVADIGSYINGTADATHQTMSTDEFLETIGVRLHAADNTSAYIIFGVFGLAAIVMFVNYRTTGEWEKKAIEERDEAHTVAFTDPLTGVKSKHAFAVKEGNMETQIVDGDVDEFGVIVCDVNGLKKINDTLGHKAGDEYIRSACKMLCEYFKHSPVYRVGGDEFVVLLQGRDFEDRHDIMRDINAEIEGNIGKDKVVISLGLSDFDPEVDESFHEVFQRADNLMYERKMQLKGMGAVTRD